MRNAHSYFNMVLACDKPTASYPLSANFIGGEGRGEVVLRFQKVRLFIFRSGCLRAPLSLILSPHSVCGERRPKASGYFMRLKRLSICGA